MDDNWFEVEGLLRSALAEAIEAVHCHVFVEGDDNYYVQFAFEPGEVYAEAVSNRFLDGEHRLGPADDQKLRALGWLPPVRSLQNGRGQPLYPNWYRSWRGPQPPIDEIVEVTVRTMRDVFWVPVRQIRVWGRNCDWCAGDVEAS